MQSRKRWVKFRCIGTLSQVVRIKSRDFQPEKWQILKILRKSKVGNHKKHEH
jgi:hypothetical protein